MISFDGMQIATASGFGVHLWNATTGQRLRTLEDLIRKDKPFCGGISPIGSSPDGASSFNGPQIISRDAGEKRIVWDTTTGHRLTKEIGEDDSSPQSSISHGQLRVVAEGKDVLVVRKKNKVDLWAEDAARREFTDPDYHEKAATEAEASRNWFAARFHFRWLVEHVPDNTTFRERLKRAEAAHLSKGQAKIAPLAKPERSDHERTI